jgi:hypothetical protein
MPIKKWFIGKIATPIKPKTLQAEEVNSKEVILAQNIMRLSFQFSQGNPKIQVPLIQFMLNFYKIEISDFQKNIEPVGYIKTVLKNLKLNKSHHLGAVYDYEELSIANDITKHEQKTEKDLVETFTKFLIEIDLKYLNSKEGRPGRDNSAVGNNTLSDRFCSFFVNYIIRDEGSGLKGFDDLLLKVRNKIYNNSLASRVNNVYLGILELVKIYNFRHPETPVTKEELQRLGVNIEFE